MAAIVINTTVQAVEQYWKDNGFNYYLLSETTRYGNHYRVDKGITTVKFNVHPGFPILGVIDQFREVYDLQHRVDVNILGRKEA